MSENDLRIEYFGLTKRTLVVRNFFLIGNLTGVVHGLMHYFDTHTHYYNIKYVSVSPPRAIQFQIRWEHRRPSAPKWTRSRDRLCSWPTLKKCWRGDWRELVNQSINDHIFEVFLLLAIKAIFKTFAVPQQDRLLREAREVLNLPTKESLSPETASDRLIKIFSSVTPAPR